MGNRNLLIRVIIGSAIGLVAAFLLTIPYILILTCGFEGGRGLFASLCLIAQYFELLTLLPLFFVFIFLGAMVGLKNAVKKFPELRNTKNPSYGIILSICFVSVIGFVLLVQGIEAMLGIHFPPITFTEGAIIIDFPWEFRLDAPLLYLISLLKFPLGVIAIISAIGLWKQKNWARILTITLALIFVISNVFPIMEMIYRLNTFGRVAPGQKFGQTITLIALSIATMLYFMISKKVRHFFQKPNRILQS